MGWLWACRDPAWQYRWLKSGDGRQTAQRAEGPEAGEAGADTLWHPIHPVPCVTKSQGDQIRDWNGPFTPLLLLAIRRASFITVEMTEVDQLYRITSSLSAFGKIIKLKASWDAYFFTQTFGFHICSANVCSLRYLSHHLTSFLPSSSLGIKNTHTIPTF